jgi:TP901 family phage tail tape measure protein
MAATVVLNVDVNDAQALAKLAKLDADVKALEGKKHVITLEIKGAAQIQNVTKEMVQYAKIQAQIQKEELALQRAAEQRKKAEANAAAAKERNAAAEKNLQTATERRIAAEQRGQNLSRQRTLELEKQQTTADKLAASEKNHEMQLERTAERTRELMQLEEQRSNNRLTLENARSDGKARVQELKNEGAAARDAAGGYNALQVALGNLASRAIHAVFRKITQAIREAVTEMKSVDTELTNISKVSGKTGDALESIGEKAYDTAAKYGVAASEYLQAVYAMQKAGMGDNSEAMGELAVKTMLVGDTTQEVATKFLLATNAAWKLEGNMERLGQIVDEADYINNNYATSLDKLAAGMPIVASVAENAGMSAEETMAALGTITAATQESGTKAATALRALILNISKEVGTFITDEGEEFEVTEESVKTVQGLLEKYAKTEVDAAKAAGELLDPMTAIRALFKGMAEDDLNDVELFNLLSGMGGKLRTNQLTALVKNFDTLYTDMMGNIANAAGTADSEIDLMMNSWERKTAQLKNSWTRLIADIVSSDLVKDGMDWLTQMVDKADEFVDKFKDPFYESNNLLDTIKDLEDEYATLNEKAQGTDLTKAEQERLALIEKQLELKRLIQKEEEEAAAKELQASLTRKTGPTTLDAYNARSLREAAQGVEFTGTAEEYRQSLAGIVKEYQDYYDAVIQVRDAGGQLTEHQKQFISDFETISDVSGDTSLTIGNLVDGYRELVDAEGNVRAKAVDATEAQKAELEDLLQKYQEYQDAFAANEAAQTEDANRRAEAFDALDKAQVALSDAYYSAGEDTRKAFDQITSGEEDATSAAGDVASAAGAIGPEVDSVIPAVQRLTAAFQEAAAAAGSVSVGPISAGVGGHAAGTRNAPGGPSLVNELGPELISDNGRAYIANGGRPGIVNLSRGAIVLNAKETQQALSGKGGRGKSIPAFATGTNLPTNVLGGSLYVVHTNNTPEDLAEYRTSRTTKPTNTGAKLVVTSTKGKSGKGSGSGGGGGGGSTAKSVEELAKETKDILSNIEKQAKLADNRKQYDKEVSLWEKGQKEIDKMVAQYKKAGYKETDDEILDLLNKRYDYEKKKEAASKKTIEEAASELKDKLSNLDKQAKLADTNGDYEKEVRFYEEAQEAIAEMVERYRKAGYAEDSDEIVDLLQKNVDYGEKQVKVYKDRWNDLIDALEADTDAQEAANALAEKEQALADARLALENATKNRTVRTYNAATGQWEWVADQAKVKSAQETLTKAEENYSKEVKDQAISELERLRDTATDLNEVILGPALSAIMSQAESSDVFQNFARALNGVYGVGSFLASTEGSSKVLSSSSDSHDTFYTFGNVTLTEDEASSMSVAELASRLQVLKIS